MCLGHCAYIGNCPYFEMYAEVLRDEMPRCLQIPLKLSAKGYKNAHIYTDQAYTSKWKQLLNLHSGHTGFTIRKKDWAEIKNLTGGAEKKV